MDIHPIQESSRRWMTALILAVVAAGIQTTLLWGYAGADTLPAAIDGILSVGLLCLLAYLAWYVIGLVSILQTDLLIAALALLFWLAGGFAVQYVLEQNMGQVYAPFGETLPFRILFGALVWGVMMLWYRLQSLNTVQEEILEEAVSREEALREELRQIECREDKALPEEHHGERWYTHSSDPYRRVALHTGMWRLCHIGDPFGTICQGADHEVF